MSSHCGITQSVYRPVERTSTSVSGSSSHAWAWGVRGCFIVLCGLVLLAASGGLK